MPRTPTKAPARSSRSVDYKGPVHIDIPPEVAFDIDRMAEITRTIMGRLGCDGCHSGFDLRFNVARRWVFDAKLNDVVEAHL